MSKVLEKFIRVDDELHMRLKIVAAEKRTNIRDLADEVLLNYLTEVGKMDKMLKARIMDRIAEKA